MYKRQAGNICINRPNSRTSRVVKKRYSRSIIRLADDFRNTAKDKFFEEHKTIVNKLYLNINAEDFNFYIGKFSPVVGIDFHKFPGAYGYQEVEGYALLQKVGLGGQYTADLEDAGTHKFNNIKLLSRYIIFKPF